MVRSTLVNGRLTKLTVTVFTSLKSVIIRVRNRVILGFFSKFVKEGEGHEHFKNGDRYQGQYHLGHPHGYG